MRIFAGSEKYEKSSAIFIDWVPKHVPAKVQRKGKKVTIMQETFPRNQDNEVRMLQASLRSVGHKDCKILSAKIHYDGNQADGWQKIDEQLKQLAA